MRILVTGAAGFIGRSLVPRLARSHEVVALVHHRQERSSNEVSEIAADLTRSLDEAGLPDQIDIVVHLAQATVPLPEQAIEMFAVNTESTVRLLDYARRARAQRFVLASSGSVYGERMGMSHERDHVQPADLYAVSKYASELLAGSYANYFDSCMLRLFQPFGAGQMNRMIPVLADRIGKGDSVRLNRDDRPHVTPLFIDDVVTAFEQAIETRYNGVLNVAGDTAVSIRRLAEEIGSVVKRNPVFEQTERESGDLMGDNHLMKRVLGDWPLIDLQKGLALTFAGQGEAL